jgi:hypothetical protein
VLVCESLIRKNSFSVDTLSISHSIPSVPNLFACKSNPTDYIIVRIPSIFSMSHLSLHQYLFSAIDFYGNIPLKNQKLPYDCISFTISVYSIFTLYQHKVHVWIEIHPMYNRSLSGHQQPMRKPLKWMIELTVLNIDFHHLYSIICLPKWDDTYIKFCFPLTPSSLLFELLSIDV